VVGAQGSTSAACEKEAAHVRMVEEKSVQPLGHGLKNGKQLPALQARTKVRADSMSGSAAPATMAFAVASASTKRMPGDVARSAEAMQSAR
jgi:hypothetical protein